MNRKGQARWLGYKFPIALHTVVGVIVITCILLFFNNCSSGVKSPPEGDIKAAIAKNILQRVYIVYSVDADRAKFEMQTYFQLLFDNMKLVRVGRYDEKEGSWPVEAEVHIFVSLASRSSGRGYDIYLASILEIWGVGDPETYLVQKLADGSLRARRPSEKEGEAEREHRSEEKKPPIVGLHEAAQTGDVEKVKTLLDKGADINALDGDCMTSLCLASEHGFTFVVKLLIERGANVNIGCKDYYTPLHFATWNGHKEIVDLLLQHGADVNVVILAGISPLWMAASKGYTPIVKALLSRNANINTQDNGGYTPLHEAAGGGHVETVGILLDHGAQINAMANNKKGWTPLHFAVINGSTETVKLLLRRGADPNIKGKDGFTPTMMAQILKRTDILKLLEKSKHRK